MLDAHGTDRKPVRLEYFGHVLNADPAGRREWPAEVTRKLAEESFRSGLSVERFAEEWQLSASLLSKWRMALRKPQKVAKQPKASDPQPLFARVAVDDAHTAVMPPVADSVPPAIRIEHGGTVVHLPVVVETRLIEVVVRCLRAPQ
jgi:transposase-like protein